MSKPWPANVVRHAVSYVSSVSTSVPSQSKSNAAGLQ